MLLQRPGWTPEKVDTLLGKPDEIVLVHRKIKTKVYRTARVQLAECSSEFRDEPIPPGLISQELLLLRPKWTLQLLQDLLGEPDQVLSASQAIAPTKAYKLDRVHAAEQSAAFVPPRAALASPREMSAH